MKDRNKINPFISFGSWFDVLGHGANVRSVKIAIM